MEIFSNNPPQFFSFIQEDDLPPEVPQCYKGLNGQVLEPPFSSVACFCSFCRLLGVEGIMFAFVAGHNQSLSP
eukprot:c30088_g1_i1 orf=153-371(+)